MATVTLSVRLPKAEVGRLDACAHEVGMERPTFLKQALRRGANDLVFERACQAYRDGEITLSRAAELSGLPLREMLLRMERVGLEFNYGVDDLRKDLQG